MPLVPLFPSIPLPLPLIQHPYIIQYPYSTRIHPVNNTASCGAIHVGFIAALEIFGNTQKYSEILGMVKIHFSAIPSDFWMLAVHS